MICMSPYRHFHVPARAVDPDSLTCQRPAQQAQVDGTAGMPPLRLRQEVLHS